MLDRWRDFLARGPAIVVASASPAGAPDLTRGVAVRVLSPTRLRVLLTDASSMRLFENVAAGSRVAVTATKIDDYTCQQWKGAARIASVEAADVNACAQQAREFNAIASRVFKDVPDMGFRKMRAAAERALDVDVDIAFTQTPGARAGTRDTT